MGLPARRDDVAVLNLQLGRRESWQLVSLAPEQPSERGALNVILLELSLGESSGMGGRTILPSGSFTLAGAKASQAPRKAASSCA
jgi:hypothetical protein